MFKVSTEFPETSNTSLVNYFILIGFSNRPDLKILLSMIFPILYLLSLLGNTGVILIVYNNAIFHTPMYFFISNLSFIDLIYSSNIVPKILAGLLFEERTISYIGCAVQIFFLCALGGSECILFAIMAYDRYVAICNPLSYNIVMQQKVCMMLACGAFTAGVLHSVIETCLTFHLSFCDSNILHHFICDVPPLLSISCSDTSINEIVQYILSSSFTMPSVVVILGSYVYILLAILKITKAEGRQKAFSTCGSHITAVTLLYITVFYVYLSPKSSASRDNVNIATVFYTTVLPTLNPIIYSIRNQDIKSMLKAMVLGKVYSISCKT